MDKGHITERAKSFAEKIRPPVETDDRSVDEKLAEFHKIYSRNASKADLLRDVRVKKDNYGR